jgi:hypothetical protein
MSDEPNRVSINDLPLDHPPLTNNRPTVAELIELLDDLVEWENFGYFLPGLTSPNVLKIKANESDVQSRKRALYNKWLNINPNAQWLDVIIALYRARENTLAVGVANTIITGYTQERAQMQCSGETEITISSEDDVRSKIESLY